jgi:hypothetical protein
MYHDAIYVKCLDDYRLEITFDDGKAGILDCRPFIEKGGVFSILADPKVFRKVCINKELGVITWHNEVDIAPETVYSLVTGEPLPEWMQKSEQNI